MWWQASVGEGYRVAVVVVAVVVVVAAREVGACCHGDAPSCHRRVAGPQGKGAAGEAELDSTR